MSEIDSLNELDFIADSNTPPAEDTLVIVSDEEGVGLVQGISVFLTLKSGSRHAQFIGISLQLAGAAFFAGHTIKGVVGEEEFYYLPPGLDYSLRIGSDHHIVRHGEGAGCHQVSGSLNLNHT